MLNCDRLRNMFEVVADINTLSLKSRCAKKVLQLTRAYGLSRPTGTELGIKLGQLEWAQLLGASRQRVNQALKSLERDGAVRIERVSLFVLSEEKLLAIADGDSELDLDE